MLHWQAAGWQDWTLKELPPFLSIWGMPCSSPLWSKHHLRMKLIMSGECTRNDSIHEKKPKPGQWLLKDLSVVSWELWFQWLRHWPPAAILSFFYFPICPEMSRPSNAFTFEIAVCAALAGIQVNLRLRYHKRSKQGTSIHPILYPSTQVSTPWWQLLTKLNGDWLAVILCLFLVFMFF